MEEINSIHGTIKFTHECSENFLDTTIYKGSRYIEQGILDILTHIKKTNKQLYVHMLNERASAQRTGQCPMSGPMPNERGRCPTSEPMPNEQADAQRASRCPTSKPMPNERADAQRASRCPNAQRAGRCPTSKLMPNEQADAQRASRYPTSEPMPQCPTSRRISNERTYLPK